MGDLGPHRRLRPQEISSDASQRYYAAWVGFATPGTHDLTAVCQYPDIADVRSQSQQVVVTSDAPEVLETTTGLDVVSTVVEPGEQIVAQAVVFSANGPVTGGNVAFYLDVRLTGPASPVVGGTADAHIDASPGHHEPTTTPATPSV